MATEERVLCFERQRLDDLGAFQGLSLDIDKYLPLLTDTSKLVYLDRSAAEQDKRFKQLIPYVLIVCGGKILRYRRGKGGGEKRLHGFYSVGIGGHISEDDHAQTSTDRGYQAGMRRELMEEIALEDFKDVPVALINDDGTDVGQVHFGVVHVVRVPDESVASSDTGIVNPEFVPIIDAVRDLSEYESWSRFCMEKLDVLLDKASVAKNVAT